MKLIPFDKQKAQAGAEVVTRSGVPVRLDVLEATFYGHENMICGTITLEGNIQDVEIWDAQGHINSNGVEDPLDLCLVDPEGKEEDEFTTSLRAYLKGVKGGYYDEDAEQGFKDTIDKIKMLALKELCNIDEDELHKAWEEGNEIGYRDGKDDALLTIPKWEIAEESDEDDELSYLIKTKRGVRLSYGVTKGQEFLRISELDKLPKKEDDELFTKKESDENGKI